MNYQKYSGLTKELFKMKFKREPKVRTIEEIHEIYLKTLERNKIKQKTVIDCIDRIVDEVEEFEKDKRKIYFVKDDIIYQIELRKHYEWNSWGIGSPDQVKFNDRLDVKSRDEKLEFLLSNDKAFELGEFYQSLKGNNRYYHQFVCRILSDMIQDKLREIFKDKDSPRIMTISIGDKKYYVECEDQYRYSRSYKKFNLLNEVGEEFKII